MRDRPFRVLFVVQGEGRGHLTQALTLRRWLADAGHEVAAVLVGRSQERRLPAFFLEKIQTPVHEFASPNFAFDRRFRGIRPGRTLARNLLHLPEFQRSLHRLHEAVRDVAPDLVVNFYEVLIGLLYRRAKLQPPLVCIAHQYFFLHPDYPFPPGYPLQRRLVRLFTRLTAPPGARKLALSFYEAPDLPERRLFVVPPLLRPELFQLPLDRTENFLLVYLLNRGYADDLIRWHTRHPEIGLHVFWDNTERPDGWSPRPGLVFHHLNDRLFLEKMARCHGVVTTAGFETVAEALYLGKPVLMVPVEGHFEQRCNAYDAERLGAGIWSPRFELDRLLAFLPHYRSPSGDFRRWVAQAPMKILPHLTASALRPVA